MSLDFLPWRDVVDILLIGFLLQQLVLLFQRAHAVKIPVTIAVLYAVQLAANGLGLVVTSWFFEAIRPVVVLILVVVFRAELRDMLLGSHSLRSLFGRAGGRRGLDLDGLAAEVFAMARDRVGALIVLRNRDSLVGRISEGLVVDARFDPRLLRSIFLKDSPIHDGAVIIHGERITRVGAILPLSFRPDMPAAYGTRHRAAIGLSERTDAIIIVVSEERGEVTVIHRAELLEVQDEQELAETLRRLRSDRVPHLLGRSWAVRVGRQLVGLAASCLLVALFWSFYFGPQQSVTNLTVPVDFRNVADGVTLERVSAENVNLQLSGRRVLVDTLDPSQVRVSIDLAGQEPGLNRVVPIGEDDVELPPGLEVRRINPDRIIVDLVRRTRATLPIVVKPVGSPPQGWLVESITVDPPSLAVVGPEPVLVSGDALAITSPVDLGRLDPDQQSQTATVEVLLYPPSVEPAADGPPRAQVTVRYAPAAQARPPEAETPPAREGDEPKAEDPVRG